MIEIDGSKGEGGGQMLRSSLTLSLVTGKPFRIRNIRAGREKPGLLRQHLAAVNAAIEVGNAESDGARLRSRELTFQPKKIGPGEYRFTIDTAGSTTLVAQTIIPALMTAAGPSTLTLEGGTHNTHAPPFDFLARTFLPLVNRMGPTVTATLERPGFYPVGGGRFRVEVQPTKTLTRLEILERGPVRPISATAIVSKLPQHIADRELNVIAERLQLERDQLHVQIETRSPGPGNIVLVEIETDQVTEIVTAFGEKGVLAETVANQAADEAEAYIAADVPVGEHLADQLLLPLSLGSGGTFVTQRLTEHTRTNIDVIRRFLDVNIETTTDDVGRVRVDVNSSN